MELLRLIHPDKYSHLYERFTSRCFQNAAHDLTGTPLPSHERGISVIDADCIRQKFPDLSLCEYIRKQYGHTSVIGTPIIYWKVPSLPNSVDVIDEETTNDPCHKNIKEFQPKECKKFFQINFQEKDVRVCLADGARDGEYFTATLLPHPDDSSY